MEGQYTDDSELSSQMVKGLMAMDPKRPLRQQHNTITANIAKSYSAWMDSKPFDIGITCRKGIAQIKKAFRSGQHFKEEELGGVLERMYSNIGRENKESESNGSLMRITPMAIFMACCGLDSR